MNPLVGVPNSCILPPQSRVYPAVLYRGEDVGGKPSVGEKVEEPLHVGNAAPLLSTKLEAQVGEDLRLPFKGEIEAAEFKVTCLVGDHDLVPAEVLTLGIVFFDEWWQINPCSLGGGLFYRGPSYPLILQACGGKDVGIQSGERPEVQAQHLPNLIQLHP